MGIGNEYQRVLRFEPCPSCRSNGGDRKGDNLAVYDDHKYCYACGYREGSFNKLKETSLNYDEDYYMDEQTLEYNYKPELVQNSRSVRSDYFMKYGVQVTDSEHVYPYFDKETRKKLVGLQTRYLKEKGFSVKGDVYKQCGVFGSHVFPPGGKQIIITEGALDAISACQMTQDTCACVAVTNSSGALNQVRADYDYINSFKEVYVAMDNDREGLKAAKEIADVFSGKARIVKFPSCYKDANDFLKASDYKNFSKCKANATLFVPDGIVRSDSTLPRLLNFREKVKASVMYPWQGLNDKLCGIRGGEIVTVCAGTGQGKSSVLRELLYYLLKNTEESIGALFLEEPLEKTELHLLSLELNKQVYRPDVEYDDEELVRAYNLLLRSGRVFHHDHFGSTNIDNIIDKIKYMAKVADCKYVFLDHISILVSSQENGDERRAIDETMTKLRTMVEQTGIVVFLVTHLKRVQGSHEEGEQISLNHLRGSGGIAQISDSVIAMERNQQHEDPKIRNTTLIRVLKCRLTGDTGPATALYYDKASGRMEEVPLSSLGKDGDKGFSTPVEDVEDGLYEPVTFGEVL